MQDSVKAWDEASEFTWAVVLGDGQLVGAIALRRHDFKVDFGYVIGRTYWGQGIATEALRPLVNWALSQPEVFRAWAVCDVENTASARVMEKVGMIREGVLRAWMRHPQAGATPRDCISYSIVKEMGYQAPAQAHAMIVPVGKWNRAAVRELDGLDRPA